MGFRQRHIQIGGCEFVAVIVGAAILQQDDRPLRGCGVVISPTIDAALHGLLDIHPLDLFILYAPSRLMDRTLMGALEAIFGLMFTGAPNTSLRTRSPLADANPALKSLLTQELKVEEDNIDE